MEIVNYTEIELVSIQEEIADTISNNILNPVLNGNLDVITVYLKGLLPKEKEQNFLNFLEKYKYTTEEKSIAYYDYIIIFELDANLSISNNDIMDIILHNKKELDAYMERKEIIKSKTTYNGDTSINLPKLNRDSMLCNVRIESNPMFLDTLIHDAQRYTTYLKEPNLYKNIRPNLSLDVDFNQNKIWNLDTKQKYIMSIIKGLPLGTIYINQFNVLKEHEEKNIPLCELSEINKIVYFGKEKLETIIEFMSGKFPIEKNGLNYYFHNMKDVIYYAISSRKINVSITKFTNKQDLINYYLLLNKYNVEQDSNAIAHAQNILDSL